MRVTDLMVGDWVSVSGKSVKITKDDLATMLIFLDDDSKIIPIPLTDEILVKNGFHTYGESYFIPEDKCNAHVRIGFHYRETVVDLHRHGAFSIQISYKPGMLYVHTLQHLLSERGIDKEIEL